MKKISVGILKNGMRFYSQYDPGSYASGIGVKCGWIHDPQAHTAEHVLETSKKYDRSVTKPILRNYEAELKIESGYEYTFFGHETLARKKQMMEVFDMYAHAAIDRKIELPQYYSECAAIHNEHYEKYVDDLSQYTINLLCQTLYDKNPVRNLMKQPLPTPSPRSLAKLRQFIRRYYVPKNMFTVFLGPQFEEAKQIAKRYFEDWDISTQPILDYDLSETIPKRKGIRSKEILRPGIHQSHFGLAFPTEPYLTADAEALDMIEIILENRLYDRLRTQNTDFNSGTYSPGVNSERTFAHGMLYFNFATINKKFVHIGEKAIIEECKALKRNLVSLDEFENVKRSILSTRQAIFRSDQSEILDLIIGSACNGDEDLIHLHGYKERLLKVNRKKLREVANKYFTKNYARVLLKPA